MGRRSVSARNYRSSDGDLPGFMCYDQMGGTVGVRIRPACLKTAKSLRLSVFNKEHRDELPHPFSPPHGFLTGRVAGRRQHHCPADRHPDAGARCRTESGQGRCNAEHDSAYWRPASRPSGRTRWSGGVPGVGSAEYGQAWLPEDGPYPQCPSSAPNCAIQPSAAPHCLCGHWLVQTCWVRPGSAI